MFYHCKSLMAAIVVAGVAVAGSAQTAQEKLTPDKLPKQVVDAVLAKFPKADVKRATKETVGGTITYEVIFNNDKLHLHALVSGEGKLMEIHRHVDAKDLPAAVTKAVQAKYPKAALDHVHERADANGKVIGYEVIVEISAGNNIELDVDVNGMIRRETKLDPPKKDGK